MDSINSCPHHTTPYNVMPPAYAGFGACLVQSWLWKQAECSLLVADICDSSMAGKVRAINTDVIAEITFFKK